MANRKGETTAQGGKTKTGGKKKKIVQNSGVSTRRGKKG